MTKGRSGFKDAVTAIMGLGMVGTMIGCVVEQKSSNEPSATVEVGGAGGAGAADGGLSASGAGGVSGGNEAGSATDAGQPCLCTPGASIACACAGGTFGAQVCQANCRTLATCDCPSSIPDAGAFVPPTVVTISIVDALVAPFDSSGTIWDDTAKVDPSKIAELAGALGAADPYTACFAFIAGLGLQASQPPDPYGYAESWNQGAWDLRVDLPKNQDQFHALWPGAGWRHAAVDQNMRFRVSLWDADLVNDDSIGVAELNYNDIINAAKAKKVLQVKVADQTQNQLLFVGLSVTVEQ